MKYQICSAHGCKLVKVKISDGSEVEDCPECLKIAEQMRLIAKSDPELCQ